MAIHLNRLNMRYIWYYILLGDLLLCDILPKRSGIFSFHSPTQNHPKISFVTTPTQPQLNSKDGVDTKMTLDHHPAPTQTQWHQYLNCS